MTDSILFSTPDNPVPDNRTEGYFETHDGHKLRYAVFRCKQPVAKGTVVLLQGRNEFIEKYFETIRDLTAKGLWVATFDLRGQGGSGAAAQKHPSRGHVRRFSDYERDLDDFLEQIVLPDTRLPFYLLAHSTGALIALSAAPRLDEPHRAHGADRHPSSASPDRAHRRASSASWRAPPALSASARMPLIAKFKDTALRAQPADLGRATAIDRNARLQRPIPSSCSVRRPHAGCSEAFKTIDARLRARAPVLDRHPDHVIAPTRDGVVPYRRAGAALALFPRRASWCRSQAPGTKSSRKRMSTAPRRWPPSTPSFPAATRKRAPNWSASESDGAAPEAQRDSIAIACSWTARLPAAMIEPPFSGRPPSQVVMMPPACSMTGMMPPTS